MKEMKHTPGPWFENGVTVMTGPTDSDPCGYSLAHVLNPYKGVVGARDRVEANARLMATAPELLEALRMWLDIHETPAGFAGKYGKALDAAIAAQQLRVEAAASAARAAIAKAIGD